MNKNKIAIYTPVKDELYLKEWILYYKKLKIDLFIIADDFSKIPVENYFKELNISNYEIIKHIEPNWNEKTLERNTKGSYLRTKIYNEHIIPICKKII